MVGKPGKIAKYLKKKKFFIISKILIYKTF